MHFKNILLYDSNLFYNNFIIKEIIKKIIFKFNKFKIKSSLSWFKGFTDI